MPVASANITLTLRRRKSGWRVTTFLAEDLNNAHALAQILLASETYGRCYIVGSSWDNAELFVMGLNQVARPTEEQEVQQLPPHHVQVQVVDPYAQRVQPAFTQQEYGAPTQHSRYGSPPPLPTRMLALPPRGGSSEGNRG